LIGTLPILGSTALASRGRAARSGKEVKTVTDGSFGHSLRRAGSIYTQSRLRPSMPRAPREQIARHVETGFLVTAQARRPSIRQLDEVLRLYRKPIGLHASLRPHRQHQADFLGGNKQCAYIRHPCSLRIPPLKPMGSYTAASTPIESTVRRWIADSRRSGFLGPRTRVAD
jgi:hypothetical protein